MGALAVMMVSFHVMSHDEIRCYLHINGQGMRFLPDDIRTVLPHFFDPKFGENSQWKDSKAAEEMVARMQPLLKDLKFAAFFNNWKDKDVHKIDVSGRVLPGLEQEEEAEEEQLEVYKRPMDDSDVEAPAATAQEASKEDAGAKSEQ